MATNDFLVFDETNTNTMTQVDYNTNGQRQNGVMGIANSKLHNKLYHQASFMGSMIGEFIKAAGYNAQDTDLVALTNAFKNSIVMNITDATETVKGVARIATNAEVVTGTSDNTIITPKKLKDNVNNLVPQATTSISGRIQIATDADVTAGTDTTKAVTPKQLKENVPVGVPQATEAAVGGAKIATTADASAGTNDNKMMTPLKTKSLMTGFAPINSPAFTGKATINTPTTVYKEGRVTNTWIGTENADNSLGIDGDIWIKV